MSKLTSSWPLATRRVLGVEELGESVGSYLQHCLLPIPDNTHFWYFRPSGTEDVVRVYAEAESHELVKQLSIGVASLVYDMCDGTGERPFAA